MSVDRCAAGEKLPNLPNSHSRNCRRRRVRRRMRRSDTKFWFSTCLRTKLVCTEGILQYLDRQQKSKNQWASPTSYKDIVSRAALHAPTSDGASWTVQPEDMLLLPHSLVRPARGPEVPTCLRAEMQKTCGLESVDRSLAMRDFKSRGDRPVPQMPVVDASETTVQERAYNCQCKAEIPGG